MGIHISGEVKAELDGKRYEFELDVSGDRLIWKRD